MSNVMNLNCPEDICRLDTTGMFEALEGLPAQCGQACWDLAGGIELPQTGAISNIVVTGLGGSAIGGDLLRVYTASKMAVPVIVNRDYVLPQFVGPDTLVFAVSYSGNTEETLSAYSEARSRGASVVAVTTGGQLGELASRDGVPLIGVPGGISPRAATGFLFIPTLRVLQKLGLLEDSVDEITEMIDFIRTIREKLAPEAPQAENQAKQLAQKLYNRIPVIWGSTGTTEVVAQRWKGQINENAKAPAYWNVLPELNHNEIVGFQFPRELLKKLHVVILRDERDHPRVHKRIEITRDVIKAVVDGCTEVWATGEGVLSRLFSLIYTGDYTSVYLAALYGVDPGPVKVIDHLKKELRGD
ncbi:MAG: bifunctional phosphoglucose/phosphomannose isomerase [Firmicutes bacterium ADurb.Bin456]|nr:MAG: bifunctional phosphoglucose/phosphomannose isomerase [Firmicutes bacterium ADurb.Bin456]